MITEEILISELIEQFPPSVRILSELGVKCIACGEPIWGTLGEACMEKGFSEAETNQILELLNERSMNEQKK